MDKEKQKEQKALFTTTEGQPYDIPLEGSLGLLAFGYKGLMAWRAKRNAADNTSNDS